MPIATQKIMPCLWFNTEGAVRWQHGSAPGTPPDWNEGTASSPELVLRLEGPACAPAR